MFRSTALTMFAIALTSLGCNQSQPGGAGTNAPQPTMGMAENTFKLNAPATETSIKQGERQTVSVSLSRGKNFTDDVKLDYTEMPKGISVTPSSTTVMSSDKDAKLSIDVAKDAAIGHHTVTINGTPSKGGDKTSVTLKIEVKSAS